MTRKDAIQYVGKAINERGKRRPWQAGDPIPSHARFVGWQCGFEPFFVAVWDDGEIRLDASDAEEIATQYLNAIPMSNGTTRSWFGGGYRSADYVI